MNLQFTTTVLAAMLIIVSSSGCVTAKQTWSSNYLLVEGVSPKDPAIIDGNVLTVGQFQYRETTGDTVRVIPNTLALGVITNVEVFAVPN